MSGDDGSRVLLYVYDLSGGFAAQISQALIGKQVDGVWHTSVVVDGVEYFYGGGVQQAMAGTTPYGEPVDIIYLGETHIPREVLLEYIDDLKKVFTQANYNLFHHNCNNFSNELATFLTGSGIPEHITSLPADVLSTPMGQMLAPMLTGVESQLGSVQQGDGPLQLQSPLPGVTLPQYQPDPSHPATEPSTASGSAPAVAALTQPKTEQPHNAAPAIASAGTKTRAQDGQAMDASTAQTGVVPSAAEHKGGLGDSSAHASPSTPSAGTEQESSAPAASLHAAAAKKAHFEELVRMEFARVMASGALSANEAAVQAVALARARAENLDVSRLSH